MSLCVCYVHTGGADEQHRAGAELPTTDQQHRQPVQPAAFLEHVQQVERSTRHTVHTCLPAHTHNIHDASTLAVAGTWR